MATTVRLLELVKTGDGAALEILVARYCPRLRRWAHARLPRAARDLSDTDDVVQIAMMKTIRNIQTFDPSQESGFQAYLRVAMSNVIRDEFRRTSSRPVNIDLESLPPSASPFSQPAHSEALERYAAALARLNELEREIIVGRFEFGFTFEELAVSLGKNTPDAVRKACHKALAKLLKLMAGD